MSRRTLVLGLAAIGAAAVGIGTGLRRFKESAEDAGAPEVSIDVWSLRFDAVDSAPIAASPDCSEKSPWTTSSTSPTKLRSSSS